MGPVWFLCVEDVVEIHTRMLDRYGGNAGLRDEGLLRSAVAMPQAGFGGEYVHPDVPSMAAAYLFHLAKNHPFIDGNKRVAAQAAHAFLLLNGLEFTEAFTDESLVETTLAVAAGEMSKDRLTTIFRDVAVLDGGGDA